MRKAFFGLLVMSTSFSAIASDASTSNWVGGFAYTSLRDQGAGLDYRLGALTGSLGYQLYLDDQFFLIPQFRLGVGVGSPSTNIRGYDVEMKIENLVAFSLKAQVDVNNSFYVFASPTYANAELSINVSGYSESDSEWDFGVGAGAGYRFTPYTALEASYENFSGTDVVSVGLQFSL